MLRLRFRLLLFLFSFFFAYEKNEIASVRVVRSTKISVTNLRIRYSHVFNRFLSMTLRRTIDVVAWCVCVIENRFIVCSTSYAITVTFDERVLPYGITIIYCNGRKTYGLITKNT